MPKLPEAPRRPLAPPTLSEAMNASSHEREMAQVQAEARVERDRQIAEYFREREESAQREVAALELAQQIEQAGDDWWSQMRLAERRS